MSIAYKILKNGRSFHGGKLKWSLPDAHHGTPGEWHEVEGPIVRCENGLHLTTEPRRFMPKRHTERKQFECYEAEYEDEYSYNDFMGGREIVARRVRLIRKVYWHELDPSVRDSPALKLLKLIWDSEGQTTGVGRSWRRLNAAMQDALAVAIRSGMEFDDDDFVWIRKKFNASYWLHVESMYSLAVGGRHGPNPQAARAIEHMLDRKPFVVLSASDFKSKIKLHEGARFYWHEDLKKRYFVEVTSFTSLSDGTPAVVACTPARGSALAKASEPEAPRRKIIRNSGPFPVATTNKGRRIFKITHQQIDEFNDAIRGFAKASKEKEEAAACP